MLLMLLQFLLLFCEYGLRYEEGSLTFMLVGCVHRMIHILRLGHEPAVTDHERSIPTYAETTRQEI
jgi:hypothetical protein